VRTSRFFASYCDVYLYAIGAGITIIADPITMTSAMARRCPTAT
jgi:hypothetical protein